VSAVCRRLLDHIKPTLDPRQTAIEVVESAVDRGLTDVKLGDITVQSADFALNSAGAGSELVELYFDPVEARVDVGKAAAHKVDNFVLGLLLIITRNQSHRQAGFKCNAS
jgi:hypothetical protein